MKRWRARPWRGVGGGEQSPQRLAGAGVPHDAGGWAGHRGGRSREARERSESRDGPQGGGS
eukprot:3645931-Prymnesium_polylepis.1